MTGERDGDPRHRGRRRRGCRSAGRRRGLYREVSDADARGAIDAAWDAGVRCSTPRRSTGSGWPSGARRRAARAPARRVVLSTKVGRLLVPDPGATGRTRHGFAVPATTRREWDFSRDGVRRSLEESLERLGLDRVDIVYIHDPDDHEREALDQAYPALDELRAEGVVGAVGAGMNQSEMLARFARETDLDVLLLAAATRCSSRARSTSCSPRARSAWRRRSGVFNSGMLAPTGPARGRDVRLPRAPADWCSAAQRIADVCERHGAACRPWRSRSRSAHPAVAASASARARPARCAATRSCWRGVPARCGPSSGRRGCCARTRPCRERPPGRYRAAHGHRHRSHLRSSPSPRSRSSRRTCRGSSGPRASGSASSRTSSAPTRTGPSACPPGSRTSGCCTRRRRA